MITDQRAQTPGAELIGFVGTFQDPFELAAQRLELSLGGEGFGAVLGASIGVDAMTENAVGVDDDARRRILKRVLEVVLSRLEEGVGITEEVTYRLRFGATRLNSLAVLVTNSLVTEALSPAQLDLPALDSIALASVWRGDFSLPIISVH
ncbi:hypothetical protein ACN6LK_000656 [Streptomyces griseus]|uniref:hypothetical protein n=1 Tax=Streptomyces griseus TaxID=1911 RepID=UPI00403CE3C1